MNATLASIGAAALGGTMIGASASLLLAVEGRIAGISGILSGALQPRASDLGWRWSFLGGLAVGGVLLLVARPAVFGHGASISVLRAVTAGLLVGFGTQISRGCTSGHGVCGIARGSARSIAATLAFVLAGVATLFVEHHVPGVGR